MTTGDQEESVDELEQRRVFDRIDALNLLPLLWAPIAFLEGFMEIGFWHGVKLAVVPWLAGNLTIFACMNYLRAMDAYPRLKLWPVFAIVIANFVAVVAWLLWDGWGQTPAKNWANAMGWTIAWSNLITAIAAGGGTLASALLYPLIFPPDSVRKAMEAQGEEALEQRYGALVVLGMTAGITFGIAGLIAFAVTRHGVGLLMLGFAFVLPMALYLGITLPHGVARARELFHVRFGRDENHIPFMVLPYQVALVFWLFNEAVINWS